MQLAVQLARSGSESKQMASAAVVVDPAVDRVIAAVHDHRLGSATGIDTSRLRHPVGTADTLKAAAMDAVTSGAVAVKRKHDEVAPQTSDLSIRLRLDKAHPLRHDVILAIDLVALDDRTRFPDKDERMLEMSADDDLKLNCALHRPYLCTGFDIYLTHEPCIMYGGIACSTAVY